MWTSVLQVHFVTLCYKFMPPIQRFRGGRGRFGNNPVVRVGAAGAGRFLGRIVGRGVARLGGPVGIAAAIGAAAADYVVAQYGAVRNDFGLEQMYAQYGGGLPRIDDYFHRPGDVIDLDQPVRGRAAGNPDPIADAQPNDAEYPAQPRPKRRKFARVSAFVHDNTQAKYIYDPTLPSTRFKRTKKGRYYTGRLRRSSFLSQRYF